MPEKMTEREAQLSRAIRLVRKAKEILQEEDKNRMPYDSEEVKEAQVKKPKAEKDDTKIENNTGTHSGYGLAGETFGKADTYTDAYMPSANRIAERINVRLEQILHQFTGDNTMEIADRMYGEKKIEEMSETIRTMQGTISRFNREQRAED